MLFNREPVVYPYSGMLHSNLSSEEAFFSNWNNLLILLGKKNKNKNQGAGV